jgi:hypothetical protein
MSSFIRYCFAALTVQLLATGCSQPPRTTQAVAPDTKPDGARLSKSEVIRIATQTAERQGVRLQDYKDPEAHYEFTRKDKSWFVFFDGRVAIPGNHFSVSVDDQSGEPQFFGGE